MGSEPFTTAASQPGGAEPGQSFLEKHRSWVLRFTFVAGAIFVYLVSERSWLQSEQAALAKELAHDQVRMQCFVLPRPSPSFILLVLPPLRPSYFCWRFYFIFYFFSLVFLSLSFQRGQGGPHTARKMSNISDREY